MSETAIALIVKSRRKRSSSIEPVLDGRQRRRCVVELAPRGDDVYAAVVAVDDDRGAELRVGPDAAAERVGEGLREGDRVAFDHDVDVEARLAEEDVADGSAHEVDTRPADLGYGLQNRTEVLR